MDAFSEQEKEAFLDEIHKIQQVLGGDGTDVDRVTLFSSEESDAEEYDDDSSYGKIFYYFRPAVYLFIYRIPYKDPKIGITHNFVIG